MEPRKLIEVALPLAAINAASAREKSIRHGHPSTVHLWWARRPLAAARALLFAQLVDDPSADPERFPTEAAQAEERQRLFRLIEAMVPWESATDAAVVGRAREEIRRSWRATCRRNAAHPRAAELFDPERLPPFHDPFSGGGSLPLEAQRLGLESHATDLNPVAVLIGKGLIEVPPRFAGRRPVNPGARADPARLAAPWPGAAGLAADVRFYGAWMRERAAERIGQHYPDVEVTAAVARERPDLAPLVGRRMTAIAWLWARTVKSPDPAFAGIDVPLASSFVLCARSGREAYVEPVIERGGYRFAVRAGAPPASAQRGTKLGRGASFGCIVSRSPIPQAYIRGEFRAKRAGARLMAIVAESDQGRVYLSPTPEHEAAARGATPASWPEQAMNTESKDLLSGRGYGFTHWHELFTPRQLVALTAYADLVGEARERVRQDAGAAGLAADGRALDAGGDGADAYADALALYLAFCVDKGALTNSTQATWQKDPDRLTQAYARQALPMMWDYAEANPLSEAGGGLGLAAVAVAKVLERLPRDAPPGRATEADAAAAASPGVPAAAVISTDPPYYDNIAYADLSDYFYVWLRRSLAGVFPDLFTTLAVPKAAELVAAAYRHGGKAQAEAFFLEGMTRAMRAIAARAHPAIPITIYYAFKQAETDGAAGTASTGWETFLEAVIRSGLAIEGTWPIRTELVANLKKNVGALSSSIVLVCRPRPEGAPVATRRELVTALGRELPGALARCRQGNLAPVDLAQAAIGPGMAIYTRYATVLDAAGRALTVRDALALINETLDEALAEPEGNFDAGTRWALAWFDQLGFGEGEYGAAETLSKAKNTSLHQLAERGILVAGRSKVRLVAPRDLAPGRDPAAAPGLTAWEAVHHLVRALEAGGEAAAAALLRAIGAGGETARELAYRLHAICERRRRAGEALSYNALVQSWPELARLARERPEATPAAIEA